MQASNGVSIKQWATDVLTALARTTSKPTEDFVTDEHVLALIVWAHKEGGGVVIGDNTSSATYNPLNTKFTSDDVPGTTVGGSNVYKGEPYTSRAYSSYSAGVQAAANTMLSDRQDRISTILADRDSTADQVLSVVADPKNNKVGTVEMQWAATPAAQYKSALLGILGKARSDPGRLAEQSDRLLVNPKGQPIGAYNTDALAAADGTQIVTGKKPSTIQKFSSSGGGRGIGASAFMLGDEPLSEDTVPPPTDPKGWNITTTDPDINNAATALGRLYSEPDGSSGSSDSGGVTVQTVSQSVNDVSALPDLGVTGNYNLAQAENMLPTSAANVLDVAAENIMNGGTTTDAAADAQILSLDYKNDTAGAQAYTEEAGGSTNSAAYARMVEGWGGTSDGGNTPPDPVVAPPTVTQIDTSTFVSGFGDQGRRSSGMTSGM